MFGRKARKIDIKSINEKLTDCPDVIRKKVLIDDRYEAYFLFVKDFIDAGLVQRDFIDPILGMGMEKLSDGRSPLNLVSCETSIVEETSRVVELIMSGDTLFICEHVPYAISCRLTKKTKRSIEEPVTEKNVRGPHEGFIESIETNMSLLRMGISNECLKFRTLTLGSVTRQTIAIAYLEGIANQSLVDGLTEKISQINTDGLPAIGYVEQAITSRPHSVFPQFLATERPDKVKAALLEGRIAVLQSGTPVVMIAPVSFISFIQALDDYSTLWLHGTFLRLIRIAGLVISVLLPALYIALTSFHYYAVPLDLLITLAESRVKTPFTPIVEVLLLEITVEMVREAAIRLPTYVGTAISVFAGLVIGQAAVEAGLVSGLLIVIVAATAVASYVIPSNDMALSIRILRFIMIIATSIFGIIGIVVCGAITIAHLMSMDSLGQPYMQPFSPFSSRDMKDTLIRFPTKKMALRPRQTRTRNKLRGKQDGR